MSSEKTATAAKRSGVRIWTEEEKDVVWEQACQAKIDNLPLTEAFRRAAKLLPHRSEAAIGMLYYNVLRKERDEPDLTTPARSPASASAPEFKVDTKLLQAFQGLPEYMQELNKRIDNLENSFKNPDPIAILTSLTQLANKEGKETEYLAEIKILQGENEQLKAANRQLKEDLQKLSDAYKDALGIYDMFTNMASISQIMSLGDFKQQMKTTLDKWGNVLELTFEREIQESPAE